MSKCIFLHAHAFIPVALFDFFASLQKHGPYSGAWLSSSARCIAQKKKSGTPGNDMGKNHGTTILAAHRSGIEKKLQEAPSRSLDP